MDKSRMQKKSAILRMFPKHMRNLKNVLKITRFPANPERRKIWFALLGFGENHRLPKHADICSEHFVKSDMHYKDNGFKYINASANPLPSNPEVFGFENFRNDKDEQNENIGIVADGTLKNRNKKDTQVINPTIISKYIRIYQIGCILVEEKKKIMTSQEEYIDRPDLLPVNLQELTDEEVPSSLKYTSTECIQEVKSEPLHSELEIKEEVEHVDFRCDRIPSDLTVVKEEPSLTYDKDEFACNQCTFKANLEDALVLHKTKHEVKPYLCDKCDYKTEKEPDLTQHKTSAHSNIHHCDMCLFKTRFSDVFDKHKQLHSAKDILISCSCCSYKVADIAKFQEHYSIVHEEKERPEYVCSKCSYRTRTKDRLTAHEKSHLDCVSRLERRLIKKVQHKKKTFPCDLCKCGYNSWDCLRRHVMKKHGVHRDNRVKRARKVRNQTNPGHKDDNKKRIWLNPDTCSKKEPSNELLLGPKIKVEPSNDTATNTLTPLIPNYLMKTDFKHHCHQCSYKTNMDHKIARHQLYHLNGNMSLKCFTCDYTAYSSISFCQHAKTVHHEPKPFRCRVCGFKTGLRQCMKNHLWMHMRPIDQLRCTRCEFTTFTERRLRNHVRRIHEGKTLGVSVEGL